MVLPTHYCVAGLAKLKQKYAEKRFDELSRFLRTAWVDQLEEIEPICRWVASQDKDITRFDNYVYVPCPTVQIVNLGSSESLEVLNFNQE